MNTMKAPTAKSGINQSVIPRNKISREAHSAANPKEEYLATY
jgi:hypothetical protein